ncbi:hypothetical protein B224_4810 [Aeromonas media WS]|nr:hypothetical protein B224_4810 [Aeromonas media WS]
MIHWQLTIKHAKSIVIPCRFGEASHVSFECKIWICDKNHIDTAFAQTINRDPDHKKAIRIGEKIEM